VEEFVYTIPLSDVAERFKLEIISAPVPLEKVLVTTPDVNRPALQIVEFYDYFDKSRLQILGMVEHTFLQKKSHEELINIFDKLFEKEIPALIFTRQLEVFPEAIECSKKYNVPILRTSHSTSSFMSAVIAHLNTVLAQRITRHGVLIEVYGEGILMLGESGVGKSETAVELVKRGHRLVADDAVEIKKVSAISLVGSAPEIIRHFIELRGVGIIDVKKIFGIGAVKDTEKIDMVINLETWVDGKMYDRLGLVEEFTEILGIQIPSILLPVKPGRNLAIIVEIAAMNNRAKRMGYNAAEVLNQRLLDEMQKNTYDDFSEQV